MDVMNNFQDVYTNIMKIISSMQHSMFTSNRRSTRNV